VRINFEIFQDILRRSHKKLRQKEKEKFLKNKTRRKLLFFVKRESSREVNIGKLKLHQKRSFFGSLDDDWLSYVFFKHHLIIQETLFPHSWKEMQFNLKWSIKLMCWKLIFRWYLSAFNFFSFISRGFWVEFWKETVSTLG
jgi:hypothetical protein